MKELKLWQLWLIWITGTGICFWIYFTQQQALIGWSPTPYNSKVPYEDLDVFIMFWFFAGIVLFVFNMIATISYIIQRLSK